VRQWAGQAKPGERACPLPQSTDRPERAKQPAWVSRSSQFHWAAGGTEGRFTHIEQRFQDPGEPALALLAGNSFSLVLDDWRGRLVSTIVPPVTAFSRPSIASLADSGPRKPGRAPTTAGDGVDAADKRV